MISRLFILIAMIVVGVNASTELQKIELYKPDVCEVVAKKGDKVKVHYRGSLADGTEFDSSYKRKSPIDFTLGVGQVIAGWDQGIEGMCVGEKLKLIIPPNLGYGNRGAGGVIPPNAVLTFETELVDVN